MSTNPFESPVLSARELEIEQSHRRKRGPLRMSVLGMIAGGLLGGTVGAMVTGILGLSAGIFLQVGPGDSFAPEPVSLAVFSAILGFGGGAATGMGIGLLVGLLAGFWKERSRKVLLAISTGLSATAGMVWGACVGNVVVDMTEMGLFLGVGAVMGFLGAALGGALLGRGLGNLAWGQAEKNQAVDAALDSQAEPARGGRS